MRQVTDLLRDSRRSRIFFGALAQSSLGTGAAVVALLLLSYERFQSPWAIGLVLLADVAPAMVLGPVFGAAADRWSRRSCIVASDLIRAVAFVGIFFVNGFVPTVLLALLAGIGTGVFTPAALASLPSVAGRERLAAASSLYGAVIDFGFIAGPGIAAVLLLFTDPGTVLALNGASFVVSAALLAPLQFGAIAAGERTAGKPPSLLREAREGLVATAGMRGLRFVLVASAAALFLGAMFNVAELLLAKEELNGGETGFGVLVTIYGVGFISGSLSGAKGGAPALLKSRYLLGLFLMSAGVLASGAAPVMAAAVVTFLAAGYGNGLMLVYERMLIQAAVPDDLSGRVFGVKDALTAWAFALGFLVGPVLLELLGTRGMAIAAGAGGLLVWLVSWYGLRRPWWTEAEAEPVRWGAYDVLLNGAGTGADAVPHARAREEGTHLVGRS
jgi:MFS family permease